jgi:hypothetical protein
MQFTRRGISACAFFAVLLACCAASAGEQWIGGGSAICADRYCQTAPKLIASGAGGVLATWQDDRDMGSVFIQSVSRAGLQLWRPDGISPYLSTTEETCPVFVPDGHGGAIVAWVDTRRNEAESDVYAQHIRSDGSVAWQANGVPVCAAAGQQCFLSMCGDGSGGAIVSWWDSRDGSYCLYARRVDASGVPRWQPDGVEVCALADFNTGFLRPEATAISDDAGGIVVVWEDFRANDLASDIYAQRLDSLGTPLWDPDGIAVCDRLSGQWSPAVVPDGEHGAIVAWHDFHGGRASNIYAQRISGDGERVWDPDGVLVCAQSEDQFDPGVVADGEGGAIVAWVDLRSGTSFDIYAQRLGSAGGVEWGAGGVPFCAEALRQADPAVVADGAGGAIAAWHDFRGGLGTDIWANRISADGTVRWQSGGIPVCTALGDQRHVSAAPDGEGGAFFAWEDARSFAGWDIYAQRIAANGEPVATLLLSYDAGSRGESVELRWTLATELPLISFEIARSPAEGPRRFAPVSGDALREGSAYVFEDGGVEPGRKYVYRVRADEGAQSVLLFETGPIGIPAPALALYQNYPNPFSAATVIGYDVPSPTIVDLSVFSCSGELVARCFRGMQPPGHHEAVWDGRRRNGEPAVPGIYYCTLRSDRGRITKKIALVR